MICTSCQFFLQIFTVNCHLRVQVTELLWHIYQGVYLCHNYNLAQCSQLINIGNTINRHIIFVFFSWGNICPYIISHQKTQFSHKNVDFLHQFSGEMMEILTSFSWHCSSPRLVVQPAPHTWPQEENRSRKYLEKSQN